MKGKIPVIDIQGNAYECGKNYAEIVKERYPGYTRYLDMAFEWKKLSSPVKKLVDKKASFLNELYRGMKKTSIVSTAGTASTESAGRTGKAKNKVKGEREGCTSFGISGELTKDGSPLSGQNKDTVPESAELYIVLRMKIKGGPSILVLAYPGEVMGYGLWSTGMSLFRNNLFSKGDSKKGLSFVQFGLLSLAGGSVDESREMAERYGIIGSGNCLISERTGKSISVEFNSGGVSVLEQKKGILTHANHPGGKSTSPFELYPDRKERENSRYRSEKLFEEFEANRGNVTVEKTFKFLSDHTKDGLGICRHSLPENVTTASIITEQSKGILHVIRGNPCCNKPETFSIL